MFSDLEKMMIERLKKECKKNNCLDDFKIHFYKNQCLFKMGNYIIQKVDTIIELRRFSLSKRSRKKWTTLILTWDIQTFIKNMENRPFTGHQYELTSEIEEQLRNKL
jgi:hypothetical protein